MANTTSTLLADLDIELGTSKEHNFNVTRKLNALNKAKDFVLRHTQHDSLLKETTVSFTSGVGSKPADYWRFIRLYDADAGKTSQGWTKVSYEQFQNNLSKTVTVNLDESLEIYPADTDTLTLIYRYDLSDFASDALATDIGLPEELEYPVVLYAAYLLFYREKSFDIAKAFKQRYTEEMSTAEAGMEYEQGQNIPSSFQNAMYDPVNEQSHNISF